jgi:hypothetical protein
MVKNQEIKWFKSEKERLAYLRGQQEEYKLKPVEKKAKRGTKKDNKDV